MDWVVFLIRRLHDLHPFSYLVVDALSSARLICHEPAAAVAHISSVWADPGTYWAAEVVAAARWSFLAAIMIDTPGLLLLWSRFLRGAAKGDIPCGSRPALAGPSLAV